MGILEDAQRNAQSAIQAFLQTLNSTRRDGASVLGKCDRFLFVGPCQRYCANSMTNHEHQTQSLAAGVVFGAVSHSARRRTPRASTAAATDEPGFESIFDGKTLQGLGRRQPESGVSRTGRSSAK